MREYDHKKIEAKWRKYWEKQKLNRATENSKKPKFYGLIEFPYPSGDGLHVGHIRSNTAMDIISRKRRAEGYEVLYPIGWDAFGLPTENYAIKTGIQPQIVTKRNTGTFRRQLKALGFSFDWSREINTSDSAYYKWTQWIFLQFFKHGLAYKKKMAINWCPKDKIGLANEEVVDGACERCGTPVEKREKEQWMLAITKYAERLDKDLDTVNFLERIKIQQRNWIGRSEGVNFKNKVRDLDITVETYNSVPQTYRAETFTVIAPEHALVPQLVAGTKFEKPVLDFVAELARKRAQKDFDAEKEMEGIFTGRYIENYAGTGRDLPIWIASYVVADYGTGIVNASAHDERDYKFAKKFNIPLHPVAEPLFVKSDGPDAVRKSLPLVEREAITAIVKHWSEEKYVGLKWKKVDWETFITGGVEKGQTPEEAARAEIKEETGYKNLKLIRVLPRAHSQFFHVPKNENRFAHFNVFYFQLVDGEKGDVSPKELEKHNVVWLTPEELKTFRLPDSHRLAWEQSQGIEKPVIKNGILLEPQEFKGREWHEVRPDIINYLVEKGYATRAVNYKLRDWVFSRQRYWGEPIPVIHCVKCFAKRNNVNCVIVHGSPSDKNKAMNPKTRTHDKHWLPWTKMQLEKFGVRTVIPLMPEPWDASYEAWKKEFEKISVNENSILIGHSAGTAFLVRWLGETKRKAFALILIGPWKIASHGNDVEKKFYNFEIDPRIKEKVKHILIFTSNNEREDGKKSTPMFQEPLAARVIELPNHGHYLEKDMSTVEFPELIDAITSFTSVAVPVPAKDLPVKLPTVKNYKPTDTGESPLAAISRWVHVKCPVCKGPAKRETDTMPNWAGSSWYYLRYTDPKNKKQLASSDKLDYWLCGNALRRKTPQGDTTCEGGVDWYNGGMEHTTLHLLYSRFWHKFLYDLKLVPTSEPYLKRTSHGLILGEGGVKMSKSLGNVVNPDTIVKTYGADTLRLYEMFMGPFEQHIAWSSESIVGPRRFLERVWKLNAKVKSQKSKLQLKNEKLETAVHQTIKKVSENIEAMRFNTAVSALMILANEFEKANVLPREYYEILLRLLAPFAPHITEELWSLLGHKKSIHTESWPSYNPALAEACEKTVVVQVNGKVRASMTLSRDLTEEAVTSKARQLPEIRKWLNDKTVRKTIYVKDKLVNFVV